MANKNFLNAIMNGKVEPKNINSDETYMDPEEEKYNLNIENEDNQNDKNTNESQKVNLDSEINFNSFDDNNIDKELDPSIFDSNIPEEVSYEEESVSEDLLDLDMNYYNDLFNSVNDLNSCNTAISELTDTVAEIIAANKSNSIELANTIKNMADKLELKKEVYEDELKKQREEDEKLENEKQFLFAQISEFSEDIEKSDLETFKDIETKLYNFANRLSNSIIKEKDIVSYNILHDNLESLNNRLQERTNQLTEELKKKEEEVIPEKPRRRGRPPRTATKAVAINENKKESSDEIEDKEITVDSEIELQIFNHVCKKVFEDLKENYTGEIYNKNYSDGLFDEFIEYLNNGNDYFESDLLKNPLFIALINEVINSDYKNEYLGLQNTKDLLKFILV